MDNREKGNRTKRWWKNEDLTNSLGTSNWNANTTSLAFKQRTFCPAITMERETVAESRGFSKQQRSNSLKRIRAESTRSCRSPSWNNLERCYSGQPFWMPSQPLERFSLKRQRHISALVFTLSRIPREYQMDETGNLIWLRSNENSGHGIRRKTNQIFWWIPRILLTTFR